MMTRYWSVPKMWAGQTVAVLASGPSMSQAIADRVRHLHRITVNSTYKLAPDAGIIYAPDAHWWAANPEALRCPGIKATIEVAPLVRPVVPFQVRVLANCGRQGYEPRADGLRTHSNGGAQAVQIAAHTGASRILLLGFDMHGLHWHPEHTEEWGPTNPKRFERWIARFKDLAWELSTRGIDLVNCTHGSALQGCRYLPLEVALGERAAA